MPVKTLTKTRPPRAAKPRRATRPRAAKSNNGAPPSSARGYVRAIKKALAEGAYLHARRVSAEGAGRFPQDAQLARYALVLGLPRVHRATQAPDTSIRADNVWIETHSAQYRGKWVALRNGIFLGAADSLRGLLDVVGQDRDTFYTKLF